MKKFLAVFCIIALMVLPLTACESKPVFTIYNWEDYIDPDVLASFEEAHPEYDVVYECFTTNEDMYTKLKNGGGDYDVIIPSDYIIEKLIKEDMLLEMDYSKIPNYSKLLKSCQNHDFDPENKFSVPYMWGTLGVIYDKTAVSEDEITWDLFFGGKYKTIMMNSIRDALGSALVAKGYSLNTDSQSEIDDAKDLLKSQMKQENFYGYGFDDIKDKMIRGEADMALIYAGDAYYAMSQNENLGYAVPSEGSNIFFDAMIIPKTSKNADLAHEFINFMCETENARKNAEYIGYFTSQAEAAEMISSESGMEYPEVSEIEDCEIFKMLDEDVLKMYEKAWTEIFA